jgi:hypothetical protein
VLNSNGSIGHQVQCSIRRHGCGSKRKLVEEPGDQFRRGNGHNLVLFLDMQRLRLLRHHKCQRGRRRVNLQARRRSIGRING